ncbi:hypothetical protein CROQUDRAFT_665674 [Cronartium quercuum f. sp. fusiforme G11]|uniref:Uncharacterized protein n=1 Tax=Cronartium quercuum f. sp. fusiforme G11 TaxID=708437 RepID=A0A9P6N9D9_9BASI|nr:hypothetical protein CROQUDRAFT_665674 [Cronartium quercuum f. sp. fusiforme G11]
MHTTNYIFQISLLFFLVATFSCGLVRRQVIDEWVGIADVVDNMHTSFDLGHRGDTTIHIEEEKDCLKGRNLTHNCPESDLTKPNI